MMWFDFNAHKTIRAPLLLLLKFQLHYSIVDWSSMFQCLIMWNYMIIWGFYMHINIIWVVHRFFFIFMELSSLKKQMRFLRSMNFLRHYNNCDVESRFWNSSKKTLSQEKRTYSIKKNWKTNNRSHQRKTE